MDVATTAFTAGVAVFVDDGEVFFGGDCFAAAHAGCGVPGAVALDHLRGFDAGCKFEAVDVLGVVGQELFLGLEEGEEGVGGAVLWFCGGGGVWV